MSKSNTQLRIISKKSEPFNCEIQVSPDKSISHRAVIFSSLAKGKSVINNLLQSHDVENTINCFKQMGVCFTIHENSCIVESPGYYSFLKNNGNNFIFQMGNSGTSCRLLCGLFSSIDKIQATIIGDESLHKRPMDRIITPLMQMGANISANNGLLPLNIIGTKLQGINYEIPIASAQIKSSILLAGLYANGETILWEKTPTRNHTENILAQLGIGISIDQTEAGTKIALTPQSKDINPNIYDINGDFSSAAFFIVATLIMENSTLLIKNVNLNPLRSAFLNVCIKMGANIDIINIKEDSCEPKGDILVKSSILSPISLSKSEIAIMIDEFPIYFVLCSFIDGVSHIDNINELTKKESNRIEAMAKNLILLGVDVQFTDSSITINGKNSDITVGNLSLDTYHDHRVAMSLIIMGLRCTKGIQINNCNNIYTSFPDFLNICKKLNLNVK